jgi:hypothetical protein
MHTSPAAAPIGAAAGPAGPRSRLSPADPARHLAPIDKRRASGRPNPTPRRPGTRRPWSAAPPPRAAPGCHGDLHRPGEPHRAPESRAATRRPAPPGEPHRRAAPESRTGEPHPHRRAAPRLTTGEPHLHRRAAPRLHRRAAPRLPRRSAPPPPVPMSRETAPSGNLSAEPPGEPHQGCHGDPHRHREPPVEPHHPESRTKVATEIRTATESHPESRTKVATEITRRAAPKLPRRSAPPRRAARERRTKVASIDPGASHPRERRTKVASVDPGASHQGCFHKGKQKPGESYQGPPASVEDKYTHRQVLRMTATSSAW